MKKLVIISALAAVFGNPLYAQEAAREFAPTIKEFVLTIKNNTDKSLNIVVTRMDEAVGSAGGSRTVRFAQAAPISTIEAKSEETIKAEIIATISPDLLIIATDTNNPVNKINFLVDASGNAGTVEINQDAQGYPQMPSNAKTPTAEWY